MFPCIENKEDLIDFEITYIDKVWLKPHLNLMWITFHFKYPGTQADLTIECYANYKDHSGPGYTMLHFKLHYF